MNRPAQRTLSRPNPFKPLAALSLRPPHPAAPAASPPSAMSYANNSAIPRTPPRPTRFQSASPACSAVAPIPFPSLDAEASSAPMISQEYAAAAASLSDLLMLQKSSSPDSSAED